MGLILSVERTLLLEEFTLAPEEFILELEEFIPLLAEFIRELEEFIPLLEEFILALGTDIRMDTVRVTTATADTSSNSNPDFSVDSAAEKTALKTTTKPETMSAARGKRVARIQLKEPKRPKEWTDVLLPVMLTPDSSV